MEGDFLGVCVCLLGGEFREGEKKIKPQNHTVTHDTPKETLFAHNRAGGSVGNFVNMTPPPLPRAVIINLRLTIIRLFTFPNAIWR